jgi:hypothetical protein
MALIRSKRRDGSALSSPQGALVCNGRPWLDFRRVGVW